MVVHIKVNWIKQILSSFSHRDTPSVLLLSLSNTSQSEIS